MSHSDPRPTSLDIFTVLRLLNALLLCHSLHIYISTGGGGGYSYRIIGFLSCPGPALFHHLLVNCISHHHSSVISHLVRHILSRASIAFGSYLFIQHFNSSGGLTDCLTWE